MAALLLQKAGGPTSLTENQIRLALRQSARPHDLDSFFSEAIAGPSQATVVAADGNSSNASSTDRNFFRIEYHGSGTLRSVTFDLAPAGLKFDSSATGFPFALGDLVGIGPEDITSGAPSNNPSFTIHFQTGAFQSGDSITFGIDRDLLGDGGGNSA